MSNLQNLPEDQSDIIIKALNRNKDIKQDSEELKITIYSDDGTKNGKIPGNDVKDYRRCTTTWVQSFGFSRSSQHIPPQGPPLDYDPSSRNSFVKYVFLIVFIMLCLTTMFGTLIYCTPVMKEMFLEFNLVFLIASLIIVMAMSYVMFCSACSRSPPCNFICLFLTVIGMSLLVGAITVRYDTTIILYAVLTTLVVVAVCILLACTSFDFTAFMLYIVAISVAFAVLATIVSVTMLVMGVYYKPVHLVILIVGTLIQVVVLIMELQMILGGKSVETGEDDYALAAFMLYTSIIEIFINLIQIFGLIDN